MMRRLPLALASLVLTGCQSSTAPTLDTPAQSFAYFWSEFDANYSYFDYKGIDWPAARTTYEAEASAARDIPALVQVLTRMVAPMRDLHVGFIDPGGTWIPGWTSTRAPNWDRNLWLTYTARMGWRQVAPDIGYGSFGDVGYMAIGSWNSGRFTSEQVDGMLDAVRQTRALILDVRPNGGGNDALALAVAARFTQASRITEYNRFRNGPRHSDFGPLLERRVGPRGSWQYTKPVYLLVGRGVASSNESFVAAMKGLPQVTVLGDTTAGASGNPRQYPLGHGWKFSVPRWLAYTADMRMIEWNGIAPDVVVPFAVDEVVQGRDPVIEEALRRAGAASASFARVH